MVCQVFLAYKLFYLAIHASRGSVGNTLLRCYPNYMLARKTIEQSYLKLCCHTRVELKWSVVIFNLDIAYLLPSSFKLLTM